MDHGLGMALIHYRWVYDMTGIAIILMMLMVLLVLMILIVVQSVGP